jgi:hypothetical protein
VVALRAGGIGLELGFTKHDFYYDSGSGETDRNRERMAVFKAIGNVNVSREFD